MLYFLLILLSTSCYAQLPGLRGEIDRFVNQIDQASASIKDAMTTFTADYSSSAAAVADKVYTFTGTTSSADRQNPVASIRYGYVDAYASPWLAAGADNLGMYTLEVTFKNFADYPDIHPSLANKTVLFVAYGPGPQQNIIYTTGTTSGSANLADASTMSRISGFTCYLKTARCNATNGNNPVKTCSGEDVINADPANPTVGHAPGMLDSNHSQINLFYYVTGPLSRCADQNAVKNSMGA